MKLLTDDELRMNQEASRAAAEVLADTVEAATRCDQLPSSIRAEAARLRTSDRGLPRGSSAVRTNGEPGSAALPKRFILAVTTSYVYALEEKQDGGKLLAGKMLGCWHRAPLVAKIRPAILNVGERVPDDRQVLTLELPGEGGHSPHLVVAADRHAGAKGKRHRLAVAKDAAGRRVIDVLVGQDRRGKADRLHPTGRPRHAMAVRRHATGSRPAGLIAA
jgi:hypothetical protein